MNLFTAIGVYCVFSKWTEFERVKTERRIGTALYRIENDIATLEDHALRERLMKIGERNA